ncbi:1-phosphofructokinase family hexose kinase [Actinotalea subterranea]|uniref:1-phosphofructokinase family hexose kinase n=1 Tax=Actinotalea subterranea TaxID=2607497 RepID=UPI00165E6EAC|nr:PfkB family carbohydrate kinase [Actinotalea subterranea]
MISAVALSPSLDVTYRVASLHGIQRPEATRRVAGGKSLNAARAAARLGADVLAVAVLGGGTGDVVRRAAEEDGVRVDAVAGRHLTRTCVSVSAASTGDLTEVYEQATRVEPDELESLLARVAARARARPGWWLVSGALPTSLPDDTLSRLVRVLHDAGVRVAVDSHGPALASAVDTDPPDLVKVNRAEAAEVLGLPVDTPLGELVRSLRARAGVLAVVTDGTAGVAASDGDVGLVARLDGHVGDYPVGSGDSFLGALLVALDRGDGLADALALATAAATANAQVPGAAVFSPELVGRLVPEVRVGVLAGA